MKFIVMMLLVLSSCGRNNGTPSSAPSPSDDAKQKPKIEGLDLNQTILAKGGHWRVSPNWFVGPSAGETQQIENKLQLLFVTPAGAAVDTLTDVSFVPFMSKHGHGLGRIKPKVSIGELGAVSVTGLQFTMPGPWEISVKGTVDGVADEAVLNVDVIAK